MEKLTVLFEEILKLLGVPVNEHTIETPQRLAKAWWEMTEGLRTPPPELKTFPYDKEDQLVISKDIPYTSLCAHHFLPFTGVVHIGYVTNDKIIGISKLARLVEWVALKPQTQELMTNEIAEIIWEKVQPKGVMVIVTGSHMCQEARGVKKPSEVVTSAIKGVFKTKGGLNPREEMLKLIRT